MGTIFQFYRRWGIFRLKKPKLDPQCLLSCNCLTGPSVLDVNDQKRISSNQVNTPECLFFYDYKLHIVQINLLNAASLLPVLAFVLNWHRLYCTR